MTMENADDLSGQELFDQVTGGAEREARTAEPEPQAEATAEKPEPTQARDEHGRFAGKEEAKADAEPQATDAQSKDAMVPSSRLREEAEARRRYEAELAQERAEKAALMRLLQSQQQPNQQQQPQQPIDPVEAVLNDPAAFIGSQINPVREEISHIREEFSRNFAVMKHGEEKVSAAYQALDSAIRAGQMDGNAVREALKNSRDPYGEMVTWHERAQAPSVAQQQAQEIAALKAEIEAMKGHTGAPAQNAAPANVVRIPPSLNRATSAASSGSGAMQSISDGDLWNKVTGGR